MGSAIHPLGKPMRPRAKRGRGKYKADYGPSDLYEFYKRITPASNQVENSEVFHKVIHDFHNKIVEKLIREGKAFNLPFNNGEVRVCKFLRNRGTNLPIDYKRSYELGFRVAHLNEERKGAIYKWKWIKPRHIRGRKPYLYFYSFVPCRTIKRKLAAELKANSHYDYFEFTKISTYS